MLTFLLTWLSYFLIITLALVIVFGIWMKTANPAGIAYAMAFFLPGPLLPFVLIGLPLLLAIIGSMDPLGWFWTGVVGIDS